MDDSWPQRRNGLHYPSSTIIAMEVGNQVPFEELPNGPFLNLTDHMHWKHGGQVVSGPKIITMGSPLKMIEPLSRTGTDTDISAILSDLEKLAMSKTLDPRLMSEVLGIAWELQKRTQCLRDAWKCSMCQHVHKYGSVYIDSFGTGMCANCGRSKLVKVTP